MCGRYSLFVPPTTLETRFDIQVGTTYEARYNAAPGQSLPVITDAQPDRLSTAEWGLVPPWADDGSEGQHINARAETVAERPSFAAAFEQTTGGRCLVPADGFYEWTEQNGTTQPYRVTREDGTPFAMAGLYSRFEPTTTQAGLDAFTGGESAVASEPIETFTIVTTEPNELVTDLHHRMAVILPRRAERQWLTAAPDRAAELLEPAPAEPMEAYPVSETVNDPANDSPAVVEPLE